MSASKKTVTRQDVLHMAQLSRLTVGEDEIDLFCRQLSLSLIHISEPTRH